jgi:hypothetical protein
LYSTVTGTESQSQHQPVNQGLMRVPRGPSEVPQSLRSGVRVIEITTNPAVNYSSSLIYVVCLELKLVMSELLQQLKSFTRFSSHRPRGRYHSPGQAKVCQRNHSKPPSQLRNTDTCRTSTTLPQHKCACAIQNMPTTSRLRIHGQASSSTTTKSTIAACCVALWLHMLPLACAVAPSAAVA